MNKKIILTRELIEKYDKPGSFYTDYPPSGLWLNCFGDKEYRKALTELTKKENHPLSVYIHYPFCQKQCLYCQCHTIISRDREKTGKFISDICKEISTLKKFFDNNDYSPNIREIHLGGGSPSFMDEKEFETLYMELNSLVNIKSLDEFAIEIDPRTFDKSRMDYYHEKGISRISLGVQDFDPKVQKAINRIQPREMIEELLIPSIRNNFKNGVSFDLIYGMPFSTIESTLKTLEIVKELSPDRIAFCILGYRPDLYKHQKAMGNSKIPSNYEQTIMNLEGTIYLTDNGYEQIGIDHFAKPGDSLVTAKRNKTIHRNAMGYTPGRCKDFFGFGLSSMGRILNYYFQNVYTIPEYSSAIAQAKFPIFRGYNLNKDEEIRREIMHSLINYSCVSFAEFEKKHNIDFKYYFKEEINSLQGFIDDNLVEISKESLNVTLTGRFFYRHICEVFDILLKGGKHYKHSREDLITRKLIKN